VYECCIEMDDLLQAFNIALERLWRAVEKALDNLDQLRRFLIVKLELVLQFLERIRVLLKKFIWIIVRFGLIVAPPIAGLIIALAIGSIALFVMMIILSSLIAYAFFARQIHGDFSGEKFAKSTLNSSVAPATQVFAVAITAIAVIIAYLIDKGFFIGVLIFVAEFFVVFLLRREISESQRAP